jgi:predicted hotdog family 3-hydroxylacyl-ACP dehydratase
MNLAGFDVRDLLAHRDHMLLVDRIMKMDKDLAVTRSVVTDQWPLVDQRGANPLILVEVVAQTAGVHNGWRLLQEQGADADHRGWMAGIKNSLFFVNSIAIGTEIITETQNQFEYDGYREIRGVAAIQGQTAAEVILQLVQANPQNSG